MNENDIKTLMQEYLNSTKLLLESNRLLNERMDKLEIKNTEPPRTTTGFNTPLVTLGPRLQKINPETLQLIKVYETVSECMNENNKIKRPSLNKAVIENTVYNGFRWLLVDRNEDATVITAIERTKQTKIQNLGYIAKMNKEKTEIINVYLDRKNASSSNGYKSLSALDTPVKKFTLSNGYYYLLYDSCEDELKNGFVEKYGEPLLYKDGVGKYDSDNNLIKEFICKYDCVKNGIGEKTLRKALNNNQMYNNHYYKSIGSKLQCI